MICAVSKFSTERVINACEDSGLFQVSLVHNFNELVNKINECTKINKIMHTKYHVKLLHTKYNRRQDIQLLTKFCKAFLEKTACSSKKGIKESEQAGFHFKYGGLQLK